MTLFKIEWQNNKKNILIWTVALALIMTVFMSLFPSMENSGMKEMMTTQLETLPQNMLKAFHLNSGPSLVQTTGFFAYIFQYIFIAASIFSIMLGNKMLVKEETEGTIEFLYAQPISRKRIIIEKFVATISMLVVFWGSTYLVSLAASVFFNQDVMKLSEIITAISKIFVTEFFVLLFFLSLGFLLSSFLKQVNQGISMGLVFIFYLLGIVGDLEDKLSILKKISPMSLANPATILEKDIMFNLMGILLAISLVLFILATLIYQRKDLEI
ncbi:MULTISPECIES: ABC transporter permease subunit [Vagococcus]|uniref:ABC transporter, permease protein n=1 Tax=Vagococcus fluvialis bH819 TaxID=1255619 RepID=A0A1X6WPB2_9ENTE|nr:MULTISPECIES: ABC transporter permease subunit [Vagococcus]SLM85506.1 ABC transporter, permease protein [Vagococcus fluvialis bH819]